MFSLCLLFLLLPAQAQSLAIENPHTLKNLIEKTLLDNPKILLDVQQKLSQQLSDERNAEKKNLVNHFFQDNPAVWKNNKGRFIINLNDSRKGPAQGQKKMMVFLSPYCPHCQDLVQDFIQMMSSQGPSANVELAFATGDDAKSSALAKAFFAAHHLNKFKDFFQAVKNKLKPEQNVADDTKQFLETAKEIGLNANEFEKHMNEEDFASALQAMTQLASELKVGAFPTIISHHKGTYDIQEGRPQDPNVLLEILSK